MRENMKYLKPLILLLLILTPRVHAEESYGFVAEISKKLALAQYESEDLDDIKIKGTAALIFTILANTSEVHIKS